ncbi:MAG: DUF2318 domain-containing protein [Chloroflexi bacterium]|nr:DUF2318 domain-containing protein [Chloroflexota bacterium]
MVEAMVIALREGIEAALVLGIILTYLRRTGRGALNPYVYVGLGLAVAVSIASAIVIQAVGFDPENEVLEGTLLGIGGIFVASMVVWMWRSSQSLRQDMEGQMQSLVGKGGSGWRTGMGFLAFTLFMVAREGVEMVLFLWAVTLGQAGLLEVIGAVLGLGLAVLFALLFIRGSLRIKMGRFLRVTSVVLLVLALRLLVGSVHEFAEVGLVPMSGEVMKVLGYFVRDRETDLLFMALIALPIGLLLWDYSHSPAVPVSLDETAAQRRQRLAARHWERVWQLGLGGAAAVILLSLGSSALVESPFIDLEPLPVAGSQGYIRLSTADWEPNALKKFVYNGGNGQVRFLAVKLPDGDVVTSLDACQICGNIGYMQERGGEVAVCKNCNAPIPMGSMGMGGGCNPLPLASVLEGSTLIVAVKDLR